MPPAVAPDPPRQNPSGPESAAAFMANPRLGLGLAPPGADPNSAAPPPAPPSRRAPRLAKRRHAAVAPRSRTPRPPAGTWNPFGGGGGSNGSEQDVNGGSLSGNTGGAGFGKAQTGGFVFSAAPAASQQPPEPAVALPSKAPFVFGSVRKSPPRFEDGRSASSQLPDKMGNQNLGTPGEVGAAYGQGKDQKDGSSVFGVAISGLVANSGVNVLPEKLTQLNLGTGVTLQSEGANGVPKTFVFGGDAAEHSASSRNTAAVGDHSFARSSVRGTDAKTMPDMSRQFCIGNQAPSRGMSSVHSDDAPTAFMFGGTAGSVNTYITKNDATGANISSSSTVNGPDDASVLLEKITQLNIGSDSPLHDMKSGASHQPELFTFRSGGIADVNFSKETSSTSEKSSEFLSANSNVSSLSSDFLSTANSKASSSANGAENSPPAKTSNSNAGDEVMPQIMNSDNGNCPSEAFPNSLDETATRPPEVFIFGNSLASISSAQTASTSFTHVQDNVSTQPKYKGGNFANEYRSNSTYSEANSEQGYGPSTFVFGSGSASACSEGATENALHEEIKKLNISRDGTSFRCTELNNSSTPDLFENKAENVSGYGSVPKPKDQEPLLFTNLNHSSTFSTYPISMPIFSSATKDVGKQTVPSDSCTVKQDLPGCSREALFGLDSIKLAYRDKMEVNKNKRKNKRPTRLKQYAQPHQAVPQETCSIGEASDLAGEYSPMDCSPYSAAPEHVSTEAHVFHSSISKHNSSCAEDDLVSASEHLIADLQTFRDEGRVLNIDPSEGNFGNSFSSFEEGLSNASQYSFTSVNIETNVELNTGKTETCADDDGFGKCVNYQSSSSNFSGLNFSFGVSSSPQSLLSAQRCSTRRKLRTKGGPASKPSTPHAFVQPKFSQDTRGMEFSPEASKNGDSWSEQLARDASCAALQTCETWRTSGNQAYANGHFATAEDYYTRGINSISHHGTSEHCSRALMLCYSNRAATRMSLGMMHEALQDCLTATSFDPSFLKAKVRAANCQLALGYLEDASRNYSSCLNSTSGSDLKLFAEASDGLERVKRVADWISQSREFIKKRTSPDARTALDLISNALHISPHSDSIMEMKAEALLVLQRYEEVLQVCQVSVNPAERNSAVSEKTWRPYLICKSYFLSGKLEEALDLLNKHEHNTHIKESDETVYQERLPLLSTTIRQLLSLKASGNESFQAGRYSKAVEQYSAALARNSESRPFSAVCFCNRAAAYQALGQITDAIADCSLAMVLDTNYPKAISRRATLYEMIRDYGQAANDVRKLISLLEKKVNKSGLSPKNKYNDLKQARVRLSSVEDEAKKDTPLNLYLILGLKPSCPAADIKKAYRKAALKHHPDKAAQLLVRNENDDGFWRDVAKDVHADADHLFKTIGEAYNVLSDPDKRQEYDFEEDVRNARKRSSKGRSKHRSPEQNYGNRGFNPRQWQSSRGSSRDWYGYADDDYW